MLRRRRPPADLRAPLEAFGMVVGHVERAADALTATIPTTRLPGRPLADALLVFEEELRAALDAMPGWRHPALEEAWAGCHDALEEALTSAERLRLEGGHPPGFEELVGAVSDLLAPLDAFQGAAERFRRLRA
ncbi:MAG TPA: hypothetical protein VNO17_01760 [Actinomycetota bacterium]|nr:hypothetical protein [Actinomycetota bacterium]